MCLDLSVSCGPRLVETSCSDNRAIIQHANLQKYQLSHKSAFLLRLTNYDTGIHKVKI